MDKKSVYILGICGTFMAGIARLARELGWQVSGCDLNIYPPMSTQLEQEGITLHTGYDAEQLETLAPDCDIVVGNVMHRGMPMIEALLNQKRSMMSGPEWLAKHVLAKRRVLAVSGTHGKTTTASILAWILEYAGLAPGFLIGGIPKNFNLSARLGTGDCFVIEADEYDTAFFDKRSKFIHYYPQLLIMNNLEFDHADIFLNLADIQKQFHHLLRIMPSEGCIIYNGDDLAIADVLQQGCWTPKRVFTRKTAPMLQHDHLLGDHNAMNVQAACLVAEEIGILPAVMAAAIQNFQGVKRRMEIRGCVREITVYDDFAHHPTAIALTLSGLRQKLGLEARMIAVIEIRSNTMRAGHYQGQFAEACRAATEVFFYRPEHLTWNLEGQVLTDIESLLAVVAGQARPKDHILIMSNGGFENFHERLLKRL
jgi:UDP-N-acetylmuramate: L-alanyl-gamma-D-glutamyl-meso-diaminopimelate ligase